ncbi:hypothetical protein BGZ65_009758 [Modicella reniformis]|uniref:HMG box domain-containing protein n=1 Tax=Modicella reniformis TaxID=1440133 RepID=A0A9P6J465_9FUNG|nr:hypothetical protein BGZ65_009758 [Modicella reniformis]
MSPGRIGGPVPSIPIGMVNGGPMGGMAGMPSMGVMGGFGGMGGMGIGGIGNMGNMGGMGGMGGGMAASMNNLHNSLGPMKKMIKKATPPAAKDKNCPKRPRNSYIFFTLMKSPSVYPDNVRMTTARDDIKKKHPEFKPTEITKMLGEEWQKLSESEKESYGNMAEIDKKRYQTEMEAYDSTTHTGMAMPSGG